MIAILLVLCLLGGAAAGYFYGLAEQYLTVDIMELLTVVREMIAYITHIGSPK